MLKLLEQSMTRNEGKLMEWIKSHREKINGPVYSSVDVRNAGYKIAPVDTNIYPGGFNNLCPSYLRRGSELFKKYIERFYSGSKKIILVPENHSRNRFYFSNIAKIVEMIEGAGFLVKIGTLRDDFEGDSVEAETAEEKEIVLYRLMREGNDLFVNVEGGRFDADVVLLNNDLSEGVPDLLDGVTQPVIPSTKLGWYVRTKSEHFQKYRDLIREFAEVMEVDPWLLEADFVQVRDVDFGQKDGIEELAKEVDAMIGRIKVKYEEYDVNEVPYVFVKNDAGTYGMAVTNMRSGDELFEMNRKQRNKMNVGKGSVHVGNVIVQEGVPTIDRFKGLVAEPVVYLVGNEPAGGFFRLNEEAGHRSNLNKRGMKFTKLCFHEMLGYSNDYEGGCDLECLAKIYKSLAQIASFAAGYEELEVS